MIADFNRGKKPNLISGDFGAWSKDDTDRTQYCIESFTCKSNIVYKGKGCSLRLDYDVDSDNLPAYNGMWMRLEKINLAPYRYLTFYVKGDIKEGFTEKFKVVIKNMEQEQSSFLVNAIDENWQKIVIPLDKMKPYADYSEIKEFLIVFEDETVTKKLGTIYIDNIALEQ
jgi:hypothetical protein